MIVLATSNSTFEATSCWPRGLTLSPSVEVRERMMEPPWPTPNSTLGQCHAKHSRGVASTVCLQQGALQEGKPQLKQAAHPQQVGILRGTLQLPVQPETGENTLIYLKCSRNSVCACACVCEHCIWYTWKTLFYWGILKTLEHFWSAFLSLVDSGKRGPYRRVIFTRTHGVILSPQWLGRRFQEASDHIPSFSLVAPQPGSHFQCVACLHCPSEAEPLLRASLLQSHLCQSPSWISNKFTTGHICILVDSCSFWPQGDAKSLMPMHVFPHFCNPAPGRANQFIYIPSVPEEYQVTQMQGAPLLLSPQKHS